MVDDRLFETLRQAKACSARIHSNHRDIYRVRVDRVEPQIYRVLERLPAEPEV